MKLLHYLEIANFKCFGDRQRIKLDHPSVLIGPNNCGKTTVLQAIALWSQAVKTWYAIKGESPPPDRTSTALNRFEIVSVPVQRTRFFWHNTTVRRARQDIRIEITLGITHENGVKPVTMCFRNQGEDLVYCTPDTETLRNPRRIKEAARISVELLYPMSGLETEEPVLLPGRINVLLGLGQTAHVLRNLCLLVMQNSPEDWQKITVWMKRFFSVDLGEPQVTGRGSVKLGYRQEGAKEELGIALAGRGMQQILLILAYLYSHRRTVLIIDEPDAHLEILRQKQVYVMLRDIASENESQVILVSHSEVILDEALNDGNMTLLLDGIAHSVPEKPDVRTALMSFGAPHYVRARQRGYVLYIEGRTDLDILRALANHLDHSAATAWDEQINVYFTQDNHPDKNVDSEIERVEGSFGLTPRDHFHLLDRTLPGLKGLAILDSDKSNRDDTSEGRLETIYWRRYEIENYFVTPDILKEFALNKYSEGPLFRSNYESEVGATLDDLILERVFENADQDFLDWQGSNENLKRLVWDAKTAQIKLSDFAESFFRALAQRLGHSMLLRKRDLFRLIEFADRQSIPDEVGEKLDALYTLFKSANP